AQEGADERARVDGPEGEREGVSAPLEADRVALDVPEEIRERPDGDDAGGQRKGADEVLREPVDGRMASEEQHVNRQERVEREQRADEVVRATHQVGDALTPRQRAEETRVHLEEQTEDPARPLPLLHGEGAQIARDESGCVDAGEVDRSPAGRMQADGRVPVLREAGLVAAYLLAP